jgi:hypothetical protein
MAEMPRQPGRVRLALAALRGECDPLVGWFKLYVEKLIAQNKSLTASLEDAHREVARLSREKRKRDTVISEAMEKLVSLHRQGDQQP